VGALVPTSTCRTQGELSGSSLGLGFGFGFEERDDVEMAAVVSSPDC